MRSLPRIVAFAIVSGTSKWICNSLYGSTWEFQITIHHSYPVLGVLIHLQPQDYGAIELVFPVDNTQSAWADKWKGKIGLKVRHLKVVLTMPWQRRVVAEPSKAAKLVGRDWTKVWQKYAVGVQETSQVMSGLGGMLVSEVSFRRRMGS